MKRMEVIFLANESLTGSYKIPRDESSLKKRAKVSPTTPQDGGHGIWLIGSAHISTTPHTGISSSESGLTIPGHIKSPVHSGRFFRPHFCRILRCRLREQNPRRRLLVESNLSRLAGRPTSAVPAKGN